MPVRNETVEKFSRIKKHETLKPTVKINKERNDITGSSKQLHTVRVEKLHNLVPVSREIYQPYI